MISKKLKALQHTIKHNKTTTVLLLLWSMLISGFATIAFCQYNNTLLENKNWAAYQLGIPVRSIYSLIYMGLRQALVKNHLQHGNGGKQHHFLYMITPYDTSRITTTLTLPDGPGWAGIIFDKTPQHMTGVIISSDPKVESRFFQTNEDLLFEQQKQFKIPPELSPKKLKKVRLEVNFDPSGITLSIDGKQVENWQKQLALKKSPGVLAGLPEFYFDDFKIFAPESSKPVFEDNFANTNNGALFFTLCFAVCVLLAAVPFISEQKIRKKNKLLLKEAYALSLIITASVAVFLYLTGYDIPQKRLKTGADLRGKLSNYLMAKLNKSIPLRKLYTMGPGKSNLPQKRPPQSLLQTFHVLFVGDSQTTGEGSAHPAYTFYNTAQRIASKYSGNTAVICTKLAKGGSTTAQLFEEYEKFPLNDVNMCVINTRYLDMQTHQPLKNSLVGFIEKNKQLGIKTVFMIQPVNPDNDRKGLLEYTQEHILSTAQKHAIPIWDADEYMNSQTPKGFLWLDPIHFSSAGHKLLGAFLARQIILELKRPSQEPQ